jgi:hypothetical protein
MIIDTATPSTTPPNRRLRLRFTLRLLLAILTVLCIGLGIWTHRAHEQRRIVQLLARSEGTTFYYDHQIQYSVFYKPGQSSRVPPFLIDYLGIDFFQPVTMVSIENHNLVAQLSKLRGVEQLTINDPLLSDEELAPISRMRSLKNLSVNWPWHPGWPIPDSQIGDETLRRIGHMPNVEEVRLGGRRFTRLGVAALARAKKLESAHLWGCSLAGENLPFEITRGSQTVIVEKDATLESNYATQLRLK